MPEEFWVILVIAFPFVCVFGSEISSRIRNRINTHRKQHQEAIEKTVAESSCRYCEIIKIAKKYGVLYNLSNPVQITYEYGSKKSLNNANLDDMLIYLANNHGVLNKVYYGLCQNRKYKMDYTSEVFQTIDMHTPISTIEATHLSQKAYEKVEDRLCANALDIKEDVEVVITLVYYAKDRRYRFTRTINTNFDGLQKAHSEANRRIAVKVSAEQERSKMSAKLQYQVFQRDKHHCVICGRGAEDGVKLHIDHIKPVSKGGKTELSNLRVLCDRCNLGKGDAYDPNGIN